MSREFKGNMRTWTETIRLTDKKKLSNVTKIITQIKVISKVIGLRKCH